MLRWWYKRQALRCHVGEHGPRNAGPRVRRWYAQEAWRGFLEAPGRGEPDSDHLPGIVSYMKATYGDALEKTNERPNPLFALLEGKE